MNRLEQGGLFKPLLTRVINEFLQYSSTCAEAAPRRSTPLTRELIAIRAFETKNAEQQLSRCQSLHPRARPLTRPQVVDVLRACRELLREQLEDIKPGTGPQADAFERGLCERLGLSGASQLHPDHFVVDRLLMTATTPAEFGLPDIIQWRRLPEDIIDRLPWYQDASISVLRRLRFAIEIAESNHRRLQLLYVAASIATLHHPGTRWNQEADRLLRDAAGSANLLGLYRGPTVPEEHRRLAALLRTRLAWMPVLPTLDSPTSYMRSVMRGERLSEAAWDSIRFPLEELDVTASYLGDADKDGDLSQRIHSGVLCMKARMLLSARGTAAIREADAIYARSLVPGDNAFQPYLLVYPILRGLVRDNLAVAIAECERAVAVTSHAKNQEASQAFSALLLQLTARSSAGPSQDQTVLRAAAAALRSQSTRYLYSHVFDETEVVRLLARGSPPDLRPRKRRWDSRW